MKLIKHECWVTQIHRWKDESCEFRWTCRIEEVEQNSVNEAHPTRAIVKMTQANHGQEGWWLWNLNLES